MSLEEYQSKRRFDETPEPKGGQGAGQLRFVVQKHQASHLHYDFRLEMGGILKSWAIPKGPSLNPSDKRLAVMTEDHPYDYRKFEGTIPKGNYGAGTVMVWDEGTYVPLHATGERDEDDKLARHGVHSGHLTFTLHGSKLNGEFALIRLKNGKENGWLLVKADKDKWAGETDVTLFDLSASTGRSLNEIASGKITTKTYDLTGVPRGPIPESTKPMLATLANKPFDDPDWIYEIKWDGYRAIATVSPEVISLRSRRDTDFSVTYSLITKALGNLASSSVVLDGEIVVIDESGKSRFDWLQDYPNSGGKLAYFVFDILHFDGHDLRGLPLLRRKEILREVLPVGDVIRLSDHIKGLGVSFFELARARQLEGIMAKDGRSSYLPGRRSKNWLKFKLHLRQETVIGGFTVGRGSRGKLGALIVGVYEEGKLKYVGHTGGGFSESSLERILALLGPLKSETSPFEGKFKVNEAVTWVEPKLVCEVQFQEWTPGGSMRQPIFLGLRSDKSPSEVHREVATASAPDARAEDEPKTRDMNEKLGVITHRDKVFWPEDGFTKGQLAEYYQAIARIILPYLADRPQSLNRFPGGISGKSFFQKNFDEIPDGLRTHVVHSDSEERDLNYLICNDMQTLMYMVNLGCIELNPWNSRETQLQRPDWCVIDLDPEAIGFEAVIKTANIVREVFNLAGVSCYPKTSGATGIHIYVPMGGIYDYGQVKDFAHIIAQLVFVRLPEMTSLERSPAKRQGKVYLDYLQNRRGQTLAAPYCVRPRPGMPVSTPLHWDEVDSGLDPRQFTALNTLARLDKVGDLWSPVIGLGIDLRSALQKLGG